MSKRHVTRRTVLGGTVAVAVGFAGCSGGGGSTDEPTAGGDGGSGASTDAVDEYLSDADNYDGIVDETGASEVTVTVGSEANGGNFGFGPAAVRVSPGTTVVWEWTGLGSSHNVVAEDGSLESELVVEEGHTFSQQFEESGVVEYYCTPHRAVGMKGVVVVD